ncbi:Retrotransposable element Tf2 protein [Rhizoctonia solani]|uniref:Retrotransposable element Tf2 protein n=1 Tax=Rhizoctonia solani TaxID=456999 RepID=A0A8H8P4G8_9AGAM|nr:Retrotransposable element Tf2 protein [Rhizoctonia solani]QRW23751.1 Retrotransposable element Tf2 protein [Rhizoctonia solani]
MFLPRDSKHWQSTYMICFTIGSDPFCVCRIIIAYFKIGFGSFICTLPHAVFHNSIHTALAPHTPTPVPLVVPAVAQFHPIPNHPLAAHLPLRETCQKWNQSRPLALSSRLSQPSQPPLGPYRTRSAPKANSSASSKPYAKRPRTFSATRTKGNHPNPSTAWPIDWACHPSFSYRRQADTPRTARPGFKDPFRPTRGTTGYDSKEEQPRRIKEEPCGALRDLRTLTPFSLGSDTKRPKMELPDPFKGEIRGQKAVQWLDRMLLWGALHRDQFEEDEQLIVWILYHMEDKAADWSLPLIGSILKGETNAPTTIPAMTTKFKEAFADPDAKRAAARKIAALTQTTTTSDIPDELEAIFAASIKIDNIRRENEENRPKKLPAKSLATAATTSTTTTHNESAYRKTPTMSHLRKGLPPRVWPLCPPHPSANGHTHSIPFLVCPIGNTLAILGMTWLTAEAPLIDWQQGLVTFPEQAQIASEEEADSDPLADLPPQYHEFAKVFGEEEFKVLPPHREYDISIDLVPDAKLSPGPIYGMTDAESKALKQHIDEELATGKIRPSTSSAGAPVMFVKKADGSLRLVVDYRKLNDVTHKNVYPLPRQDDLMAKLRHAKIFTKLDLRWGYNNVRIKEGDEWKTAFRTKYGLFEYLVMPFGLTNAPAAFQHFMNDLFRDLIDVTVVIYLDDILIFSENPKDHPTHVREVLSRLMKNQLFCKLSKCHFHVTTVNYLGIVISPSGFSMDQKKVEAVTSWPQPRTVKQLSSTPSAQPHQKGNPLVMGRPREAAFQELKVLVTKSPVLIHSNPELPYYLETDASGVAMGAILRAEGNYDTHDKELLAIIKALEEWRIFLEATDKPVQVFTDHRNLEKTIRQADALSRRSDYVDTPQEPEVMLPSEVFANTSEEELEIVTEVRSKLREDPSLEPIIQFLTKDANNAPPSIRKAYRDYNWEEDLLWYRGKLVVPDNEPLKERLLREFHDSPLAGHPGFPKSQGHDAILVVIDSFSKFGHFIPTSKKVTARGLADLFITHVWKLHGLPVKTVLDRGTTFTGKFLRALYQRLGVKPAFSSAYHPESDGQTERVNQFIEFYLQYAYNNAKHAATGKTPFELVYGQSPVMNPSNVPANVPEADDVADTLAREWKEAESALRLSKERMTRNQGTVPEYSIGEKVWLDGKNVELRTNSNKLDPKRLGPFKILEKISSHAYRLELPETLKIHDVFYVGCYQRARSPSQPFPERPLPLKHRRGGIVEVEKIIDSKTSTRKVFYLIKWKGYGPEDNSWEPEELLEHSQEEIQRFNKLRLKKARDSAKSL